MNPRGRADRARPGLRHGPGGTVRAFEVVTTKVEPNVEIAANKFALPAEVKAPLEKEKAKEEKKPFTSCPPLATQGAIPETRGPHVRFHALCLARLRFPASRPHRCERSAIQIRPSDANPIDEAVARAVDIATWSFSFVTAT